MSETLTISTQKPADIAFDYEELRKSGIKHIENLASQIWTDYNIHDPGITSLEILCYALTDLSYRTRYPVPDLMFGKKDTATNIIEEFKTAKQIFPNHPLTMIDYRKMVIDITNVKNAWLKKRTKSVIADLTNKTLAHEAPAGVRTKPVEIKGYYDVLLEFDTGKTKEEIQRATEEVKNILLSHRNLDEDFLSIDKVPQQSFRLCCELELLPAVNNVDTLATIFFNIQKHLSPLVRFYTLQQMLDEGHQPDKIFEGPFIEHGFIKEQELLDSELKTKIRLSDLMQIILNVEAVTSIPDIIFNDINQSEELENKWLIDVKEGFQPIVDILQSNVVIHKNGVPHRITTKEKNDIKVKFDKLMEDYFVQNENIFSSDLSFYTGAYSNVGDYYSIQHHFPKTYGISQWGLPDDAPAERKKQAKQLQAYLWLFDQLLANYLKQLSSVKNFFSLKDEQQTYFTQLVNDFKDADKLFADNTKIETNLQDAVEEPGKDGFLLRRNIFLDHLLSRFAESFYDYVNTLDSLFPYTDTKKIVDLKRNFLDKYPMYSSQRALAYNYSSPGLWESDNISGFEKRVQKLLGFDNINRRTLVNIYSIIKEEDNAGVKKFWFELIDSRKEITLLQGGEKFDDMQGAKDELDIALMLTAKRDNFKIVKDSTDNKFFYELRDKLNNLIAVGSKGTKKNAEENLDSLWKLLNNMSEEGMFLIEHLLLYDDTGKNFMPICVDENCDECSDTDPYSFRISIIMPAYATRFLNMDFRHYAERVMREEMPSHLMPKICWISNEQLHEFEDIYQQWLNVKSGALPDPDGAIWKKFIETLVTLKSVYPEGALMDCADETMSQRLFMLSKNSLGTIKTS